MVENILSDNLGHMAWGTTNRASVDFRSMPRLFPLRLFLVC